MAVQKNIYEQLKCTKSSGLAHHTLLCMIEVESNALCVCVLCARRRKELLDMFLVDAVQL